MTHERRREIDEGKLMPGDGFVSGSLHAGRAAPSAPLLVCIHGGGCNRRYFDLRGCSVRALAEERGFAVLLVDRPGYAGNSPLPSSARPIADGAAVIRDFINQVRKDHRPESHTVALLGHSIGAAIAIGIAAAPEPLPLRAIAVSGIGDQPPQAMLDVELAPDAVRIPPPPELTERLFHDPERILKWQSVASLRRVAEDWLVAEIDEVIRIWPAEWRQTAAKVTVPVHLRLAEAERIWTSGSIVVKRMAAAFEAAPEIDAELLPEGGHLYEATARGPELVRSQLDFLWAHATGR
jgi:pimeloyl-ACP methyl ester carboxylesterase